jgi:D-alanyl-D-alanine endopeptidase (penicillin-binding protein 7)
MRYILLCFCLIASQAWANSHALYSYNTKEYLDKQNVESIRSIASITKLFTAMTILESESNLDDRIRVGCQSSGKIIRNTEMTRRDLLTAMIVSSDNCAAETLANNYPNGYNNFITERTNLIQKIGLKNTKLYDATGLSVFNSSTVSDLIVFAPIAYANPVLRSIANLPNATVKAFKKGKEIVIKVHNTNSLVYNHKEVVISKTGFTNPAGWCIDMQVHHKDQDVDFIVLGSPSKKIRNELVSKRLNNYMTFMTSRSIVIKIEDIDDASGFINWQQP